MIQVKITNSPDIDKIGKMLFHKNLIYIGNNHLCDVFLKDQKLISNHIIIEVAEGKLILHMNKNIDLIHINGKINTGHKILKVTDKIKIGASELIVENYSETTSSSYKDFLNETTEKLINDESPVLDLIQQFQESL